MSAFGNIYTKENYFRLRKMQQKMGEKNGTNEKHIF